MAIEEVNDYFFFNRGNYAKCEFIIQQFKLHFIRPVEAIGMWQEKYFSVDQSFDKSHICITLWSNQEKHFFYINSTLFVNILSFKSDTFIQFNPPFSSTNSNSKQLAYCVRRVAVAVLLASAHRSSVMMTTIIPFPTFQRFHGKWGQISRWSDLDNSHSYIN